MAINFTVTVIGQPKGQPRARAVGRGGHASVYDPDTAEGWKSLIAVAVRDYLPAEPSREAFEVDMYFFFVRPKSHYGTGRNAGKLKASASRVHCQTPDVDNLAKAVLDVLTQLGLWRDDCQVGSMMVSRHWGERSEMALMVCEVKEP